MNVRTYPPSYTVYTVTHMNHAFSLVYMYVFSGQSCRPAGFKEYELVLLGDFGRRFKYSTVCVRVYLCALHAGNAKILKRYSAEQNFVKMLLRNLLILCQKPAS